MHALALAALAAARLRSQRGAGAPRPTRYEAGEEIYARCLACHALAYDRIGPRHCGLFGRRAGSVPGFNYSEAMKHSEIVWNEKTLDRFLAKPHEGRAGNRDGLRRQSRTRRSAPT